MSSKAPTTETQSAEAAAARPVLPIETVTVDGAEYIVVKEGTAKMLFPIAGDVFYNPVQEMNRDLSIAVLNRFSKIRKEERISAIQKQAEKKARYAAKQAAAAATAAADGGGGGGGAAAAAAGSPAAEATPETADDILILEALSATGLRSVRYWNEIEGVDRIIANDFSADAVATIRKNITHNGIDMEKQVIPSHADAQLLMHQHRASDDRPYDVVDLDPYGGANPFLDAAVQSVGDGGMLCVTCTDMAVLAGNHPEACFAKYASVPLRGKHCHEMALRIILSTISSHAARYKRYIVPMVSCSIDFYSRVFVRVYTSALEVKKAGSKLSTVYSCTGCGSYTLSPLLKVTENGNSVKYKPGTGPPVGMTCDQCNKPYQIGGPVWSDPIHDVDFVKAVVDDINKAKDKYGTFTRMNGLLSVISEELPDCPLYYTTGSLCATMRCNQPSFTTLRSAFLNAGYRVSVSHANQDAVKTNAPPSVVWDIMRSWVKKNPVKAHNEQSPGYQILLKEPSFEADFSQHKDANPASRAKGISRFPELPPNWGPKSRAKKRSTTQASAGANPKRQRQQETTNIVAAAAKSVAAKAAAVVDAAAKAKAKE